MFILLCHYQKDEKQGDADRDRNRELRILRFLTARGDGVEPDVSVEAGCRAG